MYRSHSCMWAPELPQRFTPCFFFPKLPVSPVETWMKGAWSQRSYGSPKAEAWWKKLWWLGATLSEQCLFQMLFNWLLWRDLEISESPHTTNNNDQQCFFWSVYVFLHVSNCHGILTTQKKTQHPPQARAATWGTWSTWNTRSTWGHSTKCTWDLWHAWRSLRSLTWVLEALRVAHMTGFLFVWKGNPLDGFPSADIFKLELVYEIIIWSGAMTCFSSRFAAGES